VKGVRLTHIDCSWESLTFCKNCESIVKTGNVVLSLNLISEKRFVALEGGYGVEFVHGKGSSAAVNLVKDSVDDAGSTSSESGEVFVLYIMSTCSVLTVICSRVLLWLRRLLASIFLLSFRIIILLQDYPTRLT
jgi:hypothetical protein